MNSKNDLEDRSDLQEELWDRFGCFIELTRLIVAHTELPKKNVRLLSQWIDIVDGKIELEYARKAIPKIVRNRLRLADDALENIGFVRPFRRYENWPWEYDYS